MLKCDFCPNEISEADEFEVLNRRENAWELRNCQDRRGAEVKMTHVLLCPACSKKEQELRMADTRKLHIFIKNSNGIERIIV